MNLSLCPLTENSCLHSKFEVKLANRFKGEKTFLSCHSFSNLPAKSYRNPHQSPQHLSTATLSVCYQGMEEPRHCVRVLGRYLERWWKQEVALELNVGANGSIG